MLLDEAGPLRTRADETHLAGQHVPELRQLVEPVAAQEAAHRGQPRIVALREDLAGFALGVLPHGAELDDLERPQGAAHALLAEEHRPGGRQAHRQGGEHEERRGGDRQHRRAAEVEGALDRHRRAPVALAHHLDQRQVVDPAVAHRADEALERTRQEQDGRAARAAAGDLVDQRGLPAVGLGRQDDVVDLAAREQALELGGAREAPSEHVVRPDVAIGARRAAARQGPAAGDRQIPADLEAVKVVLADLAGDVDAPPVRSPPGPPDASACG